MCATFKPVQAQTFYLAGSGATIGDTTIVLSSFKQIDGTTNLLTADFGSKGYATMEPNNSTQEEQISFTTVTQNINGTATLSGVKSVLFVSPYTESSGLAKSHPGGSSFVISNTSKFYDDLLAFDNDETVSGLFTFNQLPQSTVTPSDDKDFATKVYVDSGLLAGAANMGLTTKGIGEEATAAEINAGTQAGSTLAELIINPKYLKDSNYYLFLPTTGQKDALAGSSGTPGAANTYVTTDDVSNAAGSGKIVRASGTALPALAATNLTGIPVANLLVASQAQGDIIYASSATVWARLGYGVAGKYLKTQGAAANPTWAYPQDNTIGGVFADGTNLKTYWTMQYPWSSEDLWTVAGQHLATYNWTNGAINQGGENPGTVISDKEFGLNNAAGATSFADGKKVVVEFGARFSTNTLAQEGAFGLCVDAAVLNDYNDATNDAACFSFNSTDFYAHTSNGDGTTNHTETAITGVTYNVLNTYRIEFNPGVDCRFYINGVLKATIGTTLPSAGEIKFGSGSSGSDGYVTHITALDIAVEK